MTFVSLDNLYIVAGLMLAYVAVRSALDSAHRHRIGTALFWAALAAIYLFGKQIPPLVIGWIMLGLVILAAARRVSSPKHQPAPPEDRAASAARIGNRIFVPTLVVPATAVLSTLLLADLQPWGVHLFDTKNPTLGALGLGAILALFISVRITRSHPAVTLREGGRILHTVGWAMLLPQLLAALGGIFAAAGLGDIIADKVSHIFPTQYAFIAVAIYCLGMALFTICLGNAFAAFPVITLGIGLPIIVHQHHGNPAIMAAIGMLCGYCGTLLTPMAANFNLVPAMLLELRDQNAVIKAQAPIAFVLLAANIVILYLCVFRF